jgi:hypothetical protein
MSTLLTLLQLLVKFTYLNEVRDEHHRCYGAYDDTNHEVYKVVEVARGMCLTSCLLFVDIEHKVGGLIRQFFDFLRVKPHQLCEVGNARCQGANVLRRC